MELIKKSGSILNGDVIDTYGGDFTYQDVWYETTDKGEIIFFRSTYGAKSKPSERVVDEDEINYFFRLIK